MNLLLNGFFVAYDYTLEESNTNVDFHLRNYWEELYNLIDLKRVLWDLSYKGSSGKYLRDVVFNLFVILSFSDGLVSVPEHCQCTWLLHW